MKTRALAALGSGDVYHVVFSESVARGEPSALCGAEVTVTATSGYTLDADATPPGRRCTASPCRAWWPKTPT